MCEFRNTDLYVHPCVSHPNPPSLERSLYTHSDEVRGFSKIQLALRCSLLPLLDRLVRVDDQVLVALILLSWKVLDAGFLLPIVAL